MSVFWAVAVAEDDFCGQRAAARAAWGPCGPSGLLRRGGQMGQKMIDVKHAIRGTRAVVGARQGAFEAAERGGQIVNRFTM